MVRAKHRKYEKFNRVPEVKKILACKGMIKTCRDVSVVPMGSPCKSITHALNIEEVLIQDKILEFRCRRGMTDNTR